jgi:branched-chain amino acid transport system permease protein
MQEFIQLVINGAALGSIYALIALGYTMVYGVLGLINFAHGDVLMVGAYAGLLAVWSIHLNAHPTLLGLLWVFVVAMVASSLLGVLIERFAYRPLRNGSKLNLLITSVGVSLLLENLCQILWGATPRVFPSILNQEIFFKVDHVAITNYLVVTFLVSVVLMIILEWIVLKTQLGRAMRAISYSHEMAMLVGISADNIIMITFMIGSALAAAAGILVVINYPQVDPTMGLLLGLKAFVAAVLGGIGSIRGAVVGALTMGILESLIAGYFSSTYRDALAFIVLILVLMIKPSGLFGHHQPEKV